jgi:hypothetical protein
MGWKLIGILGLVLLTMPETALGRDLSRASLTVRTYNNYGLTDDDLVAARRQVDEIFRTAGVDLNWLDCWFRDIEPANAPAQCRQPLDSHEVMLRLQAPSPPGTQRYVSMGFSLVKLEAGWPFLATVFVDFVASVSRGAGIDFRLLLGRAIAHELGHLLLNSDRHADRGLMRAGWSHADMQKNNEADWQFLQEEIATIRTAVTARTTPLSTQALP